MFSPGQQKHYRPLVNRAWLAHCLRNNLDEHDKYAREKWYRREILDACGIYTTKQANQKEDFDKLMGHFAAIAGDEYWMQRSAEGTERRLKYLIRREVKQGHVTENYVLGIAKNMGFLHELNDMPADHLWRIWNALLRHNKRHATC